MLGGNGKVMSAFSLLESAAEGAVCFSGASWLDISRFGTCEFVPNPGFDHGNGAPRRRANCSLTSVTYFKVAGQSAQHRDRCYQHQQRSRTDVVFLDLVSSMIGVMLLLITRRVRDIGSMCIR